MGHVAGNAAGSMLYWAFIGMDENSWPTLPCPLASLLSSGVLMMFTGKSLGLLVVLISVCSLGCVPTPAEPVAGDVEAQKAVAGVGKGGQRLKDHSQYGKILSGPISTLKHIQQLAPLEIQIPHALNLFKAEHGRAPKDHAEFMAKIIEFNRIQLPELPEGAVYHYNKEAGELWVYPAEEVPQD
jgi:hypothetical protein